MNDNILHPSCPFLRFLEQSFLSGRGGSVKDALLGAATPSLTGSSRSLTLACESEVKLRSQSDPWSSFHPRPWRTPCDRTRGSLTFIRGLYAQEIIQGSRGLP